MVNWLRQLWHPGVDWRECRFWVLDMEFTSLKPREGHILSAGWVCIEGGEIKLETAKHRLFRQTEEHSDNVASSAHIHQITDQQREVGVDLKLWLQHNLLQYQDDYWVFHHAPLDLAYLKDHAKRYDLYWPKPTWFDTLHFERKKLPPGLPGNYRALNLNACRRRYGLPTYRAHHALSDALATAELFLAQIRRELADVKTDRQLRRAYR